VPFIKQYIESNKIKALQLTRPCTFESVNISTPSLDKNEVLVKFGFALLCGSDSPKFTGKWKEYPTPLSEGMPIHECVGQITESCVSNLLPGTWVLAMPKNDCGLADIFIAERSKITPLLGWNDADMPFAALGQPTGAVLHALDRLGNLTAKTVIVVGLGGIGLIACNLLRQMNVKEIIGIEPNIFRCQMAQELYKITVYSKWTTDFVNTADLAIEAVGQLEQNRTIDTCLESTKPYGTIMLLGNPTLPIHEISIRKVIRKNLTITGSISSDWEEYLQKGVRNVKQNLTSFKPLITHHFHWKEAQQAFELFEQPDSERIKILLHG
jgi:threonine dehydrogenase-like Zn-dependent dehydrogenase